jgi:hypothetical protein
VRFEEQAVGSVEVHGRRYEVIASWMGNDFQLTFHPVPNRPITGVPQATLSLDGTVSGFRWLIVDETEHGPTLGDVEARIDEVGEDVRLGWLGAALDAQIERAVDMTRRLAESQGQWLTRLHRFTLAAAATRWPEPGLRRQLQRRAADWDGSWSDLLATARAEPPTKPEKDLENS